MDTFRTFFVYIGRETMMNVKLITVIFFLAIGSSIANSSICLTEYTDINNLGFQRDINTGHYLNVWIIDKDVPAYLCFKENEEPVKTLQIKKRYRIVKNNYKIRKNNQYWSLLVKGDIVNPDTIVGWVSHNNIIFHYQPLKDIITGIFQKVLIKEGDRNQLQALQIFDNRDLTKTEEGIAVRTIFYVYDFFPRKARIPQSRDTKSLLIGIYPQLNTNSEKAPNLIGWIDRNKVSFWNTRTACEFKIGEKNVLYDHNKKKLIETQIINTPLHYNELRNPILKNIESEYYIGAFFRLPISQLHIRHNINYIKTGLEVLFVIDGTRSMTSVFKDTLNAVKKISKELEKQSKDNELELPRFALMFYRDKRTSASLKIVNNKNLIADNPYCQNETTLYKMKNIQGFINVLDNHIACDSDNTIKESMYLGLIEGVKNCGFKTGKNMSPKFMRMIIHLGDSGDNGRGNYTQKDVSDIFDRYHIFRYFSANVSFLNNDFSKSVESIYFDKKKAYHMNSVKGLTNVITVRLHKFLNKTIELKDQIKIISRGFAGTSKGKIGIFSDEILHYAKKVILANNIDLNNYNAFQKYVEGIISKDAPIKNYLLVSRTDIEKITNSLTMMLESTGSIETRQMVWNNSLKNIIGDQSCEDNGIQLSLEECNKRRNGIPIKAGFMRYTIKEFINLESDKLNKVFCEVKIAREKFRAFAENKYISQVDIESINPCFFKTKYNYDINGDGKIISSNNANKDDFIDKYFFQEGGESMAWIPIEHLDININTHFK